ncbi:MAG: hypothetical protein Q4C20_13740 [Erysipelotrichaceae bacterium]|nr:hypothetical protein [Erysipelotrichaceae bacterium]
MLGKLIRYDLKSAMRSFGPLFLALLALSAVLGLFIRFNVSQDWLLTLVAVAYGVMSIVCWIIPIVILTMRFKRNLLGDEGYLSFSLPVSTLEHIVAKVISALIISVICAVAVIASFLIIGLLAASFDQLKQALQEISALFSRMTDQSFITQMLQVLAIMIFGSVEMITQLYAALAVGHLVKDHETLAAVGAFIGFSIILSTITNFLVLPSAVWVVCLFTVAVTAVYTCITWFILDRNLNLG